MNILITGAAGFIGSALCKKLLKKDHKCYGIDNFSDYYDIDQKKNNLLGIEGDNFEFHQNDIMSEKFNELLSDTDIVFHLAAQPGVINSWGENFKVYVDNNIIRTQYLLERIKNTDIKLIFASSSSVYGKTRSPMSEDVPLNPISPYGMTKLSCEKLIELYSHNYGINYLSLRFFTVFGPGQRPDMFFHKAFKSILKNESFSIYGDGSQKRDFTYIDAVTDLLFRLPESDFWNEHINVGSGRVTTVSECVDMIEKITGKKMNIKHEENKKGDMPETLACIKKAARLFDYEPDFELKDALERQWTWMKDLYS